MRRIGRIQRLVRRLRIVYGPGVWERLFRELAKRGRFAVGRTVRATEPENGYLT